MAEINSNDQQFRQAVLDVLNEKGAHLNTEGDVDIVNVVDGNITLPGVEVENGNVKRYVAAKMDVFAQYPKDVADAIYATFDAWFSDTLPEGVRKVWTDWYNAVQEEWDGTEQHPEDGMKAQVEAATAAAIAATKEWYDSEHPNDGYKKQVTDIISTWGDSSSGKLRDINDAISNANAATSAANTAADNADAKASLANSAATAANNAAADTTAAAATATTEAGKATTAAGNATDAATAANTAADDWNKSGGGDAETDDTGDEGRNEELKRKKIWQR